jgi:hypothetical protein
MSSKTRMLGAGRAGSTVYGSNVNMIQFGDKLQGLAPQATHFFISGNGKAGWYQYQTRTYAPKRNYVFCMNQLGGVGKGKSQFKVRGLNNPDGAKLCKPYEYKSISDDKSESNDESTMNNYVKDSGVNTEVKPQDPLLGSKTESDSSYKISSDSTLTSTDESETWLKFYFSGVNSSGQSLYSAKDYASDYGEITEDTDHGAYFVFVLTAYEDKYPTGAPFNEKLFSKFPADILTYPIVSTGTNTPPLYLYSSSDKKQVNWVGEACPDSFRLQDDICVYIKLKDSGVNTDKSESDFIMDAKMSDIPENGELDKIYIFREYPLHLINRILTRKEGTLGAILVVGQGSNFTDFKQVSGLESIAGATKNVIHRIENVTLDGLGNNDLDINALTLVNLDDTNYLNGITVMNSQDDGIEIFGGSVNMSNIIVQDSLDDQFDTDYGHVGIIDHLSLVQTNSNIGKSLIECGNKNGTTTTIFKGLTFNNGLDFSKYSNNGSDKNFNIKPGSSVRINGVLLTEPQDTLFGANSSGG